MAELCLQIDTTCKQWVSVTTQSRLDRVIFSNELPQADEGEAQIPSALTSTCISFKSLPM
jgi:hypothetical protein